MINKLNKNSEQVLKTRYYSNEKENWPGLCRRVVDHVVKPSLSKYDTYTEDERTQLYNKMFSFINELDFMPNSPTLFNAGTVIPMLSACFVLDMEDDMSDIYNTIRDAALVHKAGGGVGLSFGKLRVRGSQVSSTHGKSSGSVSFMKCFSQAVSEVTAAGRRHGANLAALPIYHGDIEEFISCKDKEGSVENFNITVTVPDSFMKAVEENRDVYLTDPKDGSKVKSINAKELFYKIAEGAHKNGEPGIAFIDTINRDNPTPHMGDIRSSNPCQPGWATVLTPEGIKTFDDIDVGSIIWSGKQWTKVVNKVCNGIKPVFMYSTECGYSFVGTEEHRVVQNGTKVMVKDATYIDVCKKPDDEALEFLFSAISCRKYVSSEKVYDITVDAPEHTYWSGGLLVSNCGEYWAVSYNSCNLGSINLTNHINGKEYDWDRLKKTIDLAIEFLDCVIDANVYPLKKIDEISRATRPVGLGVFGFADSLIKMGIRYDSEEAIRLAEKLSEFITYNAMLKSIELSKKRGPYPEFKVENHKYKRYISYGTLDWKTIVSEIAKYGIRNSICTVVAPTGSISRIANEASFGIEPVFSFSYESNILDGKKQTFNHQLYQDFIDKKLDVSKDVFVKASDISWENHIKMLSAWQKFVHNGISKTINMPKSATVEDVVNAYTFAYKSGIKGITVYREGSREKEVLVSSENVDKSEKKPGRRAKEIDQKLLTKLITDKNMSAAELSDLFDCSITTIRKRAKELGLITKIAPEKIKCPDEIEATRYKIETPAGVLYVEVGKDAETKYPVETILNISKSGSSVNAVAEALGKMVSKALQHRMDPYEVIDTLKNILGGDNITWWRGKPIKSIPDALAKVLELYMKEHVDVKHTDKSEEPVVENKEVSGNTCPVCGEMRIISEGCMSCRCGSKCG